MIRKPAVAGHFYSGSKDALLQEVQSLIDTTASKEDAVGVVSPHAGYMYSGSVAGAALSAIQPKPVYVIMGPNHTGMGERFSISTDESWKTPLGEVKLESNLAHQIAKECRDMREDDLAHLHEHSIEVQLPFLQVLQKNFSLVPIVISYGSLDEYRRIGKSIARAIKSLKLEKETVIIASSDMTHYEPHERAREKDSQAIDALLSLDEKALVDRVERLGITMCGYAPAAIMIVAAKELGATRSRLVKYQTSGDVSGDYSSVVGYAGVVVS